jgi:RNA polymerase sigma factor (sigma-70 family)
MMLGADDIGPYEGLIFSTAARYAAYFDDDVEDIQQVLRLKVWRALKAYDPRRSSQPVQKFVFSCLRNQVKDLLKQQFRLNRARRSASPVYLDDEAGLTPDFFERKYLVVEEEAVFAVVDDEDCELPSTLTTFEVTVVHLLLLEYNQTEAARILDVPRGRIRAAHTSVKEKMADWRPTLPLPAMNGNGHHERATLDRILS